MKKLGAMTVITSEVITSQSQPGSVRICITSETQPGDVRFVKTRQNQSTKRYQRLVC
jgi:hypothetical protein